jgi:hypothetical protein
VAAVFIAALSVALTFLATVHWLPLRGEEPAMAAPRGHRAAPGVPQPPDGTRDLPEPHDVLSARTAPRRSPTWSHT